jgi:hypothetical protein
MKYVAGLVGFFLEVEALIASRDLVRSDLGNIDSQKDGCAIRGSRLSDMLVCCHRRMTRGP